LRNPEKTTFFGKTPQNPEHETAPRKARCRFVHVRPRRKKCTGTLSVSDPRADPSIYLRAGQSARGKSKRDLPLFCPWKTPSRFWIRNRGQLMLLPGDQTYRVPVLWCSGDPLLLRYEHSNLRTSRLSCIRADQIGMKCFYSPFPSNPWQTSIFFRVPLFLQIGRSRCKRVNGLVILIATQFVWSKRDE